MARRKRKGGSNLEAEALRTQATHPDLIQQCNMSYWNRYNSGGSSSKTTGSSIAPYNASLSILRLKKVGFHKKVSDSSVQTEINLWYITKNDSTKYREGNLPSFGQYVDSKALVKAVNVSKLKEDEIQHPIRALFAGLTIPGQILGQQLAFSGLPNLVNFAKAYPVGWGGLSQGMAVFDLSIGAFRGLPSGYVFLDLSPKVPFQEFLNHPDFEKMREREREATRIALTIIAKIHQECEASTPFWSQDARTQPEVQLVNFRDVDIDLLDDKQLLMYWEAYFRESSKVWYQMNFGEKLVEMIKSIPHVDDIHERVTSLVEPTPTQEYSMSRQYPGPGQPRIEAFDFYPRYNAGPILDGTKPEEDASTYGVSWKSVRIDAQQRGVFAILLQVVLKAKRMGLKLLLDKDSAFMTYLSRLPFPPLQILGFLDGLYRYLDLIKARSTNKDAVKQALYDVLRPVRSGLESLDKDWPSYYLHEMDKNMMFCSSCGYEYLQDFFAQSAQSAQAHTRICSACTLRLWLDEESDNDKGDANVIWEPYFKNWQRSEFNQDAPIHQHGQSIINLRSTETERPLPPAPQIGPNGEPVGPRYVEPLMRDNKVHKDSLQNLPDFVELFQEDIYRVVMHRARVLDARQATDTILRSFYPNDQEDIRAYKDVIPDFNSQGPSRTPKDMCLTSHNFESAALFFETLQNKSFRDQKAYRNSNQYNPTGFW
ncbi:hypothetical protein CDV36_003210 [Fusarium kuroshium]|uniref:Uncharacterized protein n=1 Tax=Fusarium kuroshium TaxID=2010991 RepID=A0A3M2SHW5_9HYPO|nr:hypothetical protein CDV36_003210 [Fusarium kuroshium]